MEDRTLAILIDADNAQPALTSILMSRIGKEGRIMIRRAYGDWTSPSMNGWKQVLIEDAIQPIQQFRYTTGRNATDSALIIDAMDLLYTTDINAFCIVSSDSDFTRLATRLREAGRTVYGVGRRFTPRSFVAACDHFIHTDTLADEEQPDTPGTNSSATKAPPASRLPLSSAVSSADTSHANQEPTQKHTEVPTGHAPGRSATMDAEVPPRQPKATTPAADTNITPSASRAIRGASRGQLLAAIDACRKDDGWASLGELGSVLLKSSPPMPPKSLGFSSLQTMLREQPYLEVETRQRSSGGAGLYVRRRAV